MRNRLHVPAIFLLAATLVACGGGGGGGGGGTSTGTGPGFVPPTPTSTPPPPTSQSRTTSLGSGAASVTFNTIASGVAGTVAFPATSQGSAKATVTLQSSLPNGEPVPQARHIQGLTHRDSLGGTVNAIAYITLSTSANVSFTATPMFSFTFLTGTLAGYAYVAFYDPNRSSTGWNAILGPISASGTSLNFSTPETITPPLTLTANTTYTYAIVETGTPLPTPTPSPTPTVTPSATPTPVAANGSPLPTITINGAWSPSDVANALQFPVQNGFNGTGQTVAVVIDSSVLPSDINSYESYFQIPQTGRTISVRSVDGGSGTSSPGQEEATLDVETIAALAPGANIIVYQIPGLSNAAIIDAYNAIISDNYVSVVNSSFGGCEYPGMTTNGGLDTILKQGAKAGIVFVASAGDQGNECLTNATPQYQVGVNQPASDPNVVGVGGTETNQPSYSLTSAAVWNDFSCGTGVQCAGGGGVSAYFPLPSYQQGLSGAASAQYRNVPDVSMPAEDTATYENGAWHFINGTSWSAPEYAALMAEVYEYCNGSFQDPANIPYYVMAHGTRAFFDVTSGNDQFAGGAPYYTAGGGYDNASGIGVPLGMAFANGICPNRVPASALRRPERYVMTAVKGQAQPEAISVMPNLHGLQDLGERQSNAQTRVQIVLRPTTTLGSDERVVIDTLEKAGFSIVETFADHLVVDAEAPSGTVEQFFDTRIHDLSQGQYGTRYAPVAQVIVPASLAPYVAGINLDNVVTMHVPVHQ